MDPFNPNPSATSRTSPAITGMPTDLGLLLAGLPPGPSKASRAAFAKQRATQRAKRVKRATVAKQSRKANRA